MRRRIFIAINFPPDIKKKLASYREKWQELPARWTKPDNLHITLAFIGDVDEDGLVEICRLAKETAQKHYPLSIKLNKISYGPLKKIPPRMIWVSGEKSEEFSVLRNDLEKALLSSEKIPFAPEGREFSPHITLARIRQWDWRRIEPEERPQVDEEISLTFNVSSIEVMESELSAKGPKYEIIESYGLEGK